MYKLSKQPLIEVIFEFHWGNKNNFPFDPNYRLIVGALYEHIKDKFPDFETLPTINIPEGVLPPDSKIIQYRFWTKNKRWPVVQLGPQILTVNMNKDYEKWESFKPIIVDVVSKFLTIYLDKENLFIHRLVLKYLDAFSFDFWRRNILEFLKSKLHIFIDVDFGEDERKNRFSLNPLNLDFKLEYSLNEPEGLLGIRFFKALMENKEEGLVMENYVISSERPSVEPNTESIENWLDKAHEMTDFVFSNLIRGELEEELK